ncbi:MAG: tetratricopeptide repeat protein [Betaproteobacteria bacterium]|nr:tetratricopeptide repeat protein [Betaproteobacteria bacterium]
MSSFNFSRPLRRFLRCCLLALCLVAFSAHAEERLFDTSEEGASDVPTDSPEALSARDMPASAEVPMDAQTSYEILVGEMALTRQDLPLAALAYRDLARRMPKADILERAIQIARALGDFEWGLELLALWQANGDPDPVRFALAQAEIFMGAGRILEMEEPILFLLESYPSQRESNFLRLMRILDRNTDKSLFHTLISRLAARYPDLATAQFVLAAAADQAGEKAAAEEALLRAYALKPDWELPLLMRSDWLARDIANKQKVTQAEVDAHLELMEKFLKRFPDNSGIRMQLARLLILSGKETSARQHFDRLLMDHPDNPAVLYSAAMLAMQANDTESARQLLNHILSLPVSGDMAHFLLAQIEETTGNKELARQHYEKVSYGFSSYFAARIRLARMLMQDDLASARRVVLESEARTEEEQIGLKQLEAQLLCESGRHVECHAALIAALKEFPDHPGFLYDAALAAEKLKLWDESEKHLRRLISLQPENAEAYNALGYAFADRNVRLSEARTLIEKALKLSPGSPHILDSLGWVLYRQGKLPEALTALEEAYARMKDPEIAAHLGEVLWRLGRRDEAEEIWQKESEKSPEHAVLKETQQRLKP